MLTDAQVYCMTSIIYLFRAPITAKAIYRKTAEATPNNYKNNNYKNNYSWITNKLLALTFIFPYTVRNDHPPKVSPKPTHILMLGILWKNF